MSWESKLLQRLVEDGFYLQNDIDTGQAQQGKVTLSGTAETPTAAIAIPNWARILVLLSAARCRVGYGEAPGAIGSDAAPGVGAWLHPDTVTPFVLPEGTGRTFRLVSDTASPDVYFEFRP